MNWQVRQTKRFARTYKKLAISVAKAVDEAILKIAKDPNIGERKKGDLATLRVYKFKHQNQLYLLAYEHDEVIRVVYLIELGSHQNFYRDLKR
jgi:mRNA-degrading endonuclease RelE of RelBE toxin-antitoxin system